jgi:hypothetical protein
VRSVRSFQVPPERPACVRPMLTGTGSVVDVYLVEQNAWMMQSREPQLPPTILR